MSFYNGQDRDTPSLIGSQAAHEIYLAPAQSAIQQGGVSSVMCSYAIFQIVGEQSAPQYACSNSNLLTNIVKNQFQLKGFITSDY
ncbi:glycoside hydrolase family 3 N-terminal domain-containing protein, partial [Glaciimonas sp. Cout2]|nr:glycoside hydrolase family 3 N-terminal domain-containing protein [Glaciimonas sp. Cout2]